MQNKVCNHIRYAMLRGAVKQQMHMVQIRLQLCTYAHKFIPRLKIVGVCQMSKNVSEIMKTIHEAGAEMEVWGILNSHIHSEIIRLKIEKSEQVAVIRAVRKINGGKNPSIEALCDPDNCDSKNN